MSTNVTIEYIKAEEMYSNAKTREEKIAALEEMIRTAPSHKGGENLRKQLKQKLAKLKQIKRAKASRKSLMVPKEGDAQVCILGNTQSGKSTLLSKLTNAKPKISNRQYTTVKPEIGTCEFEGVKIQLIELPASFRPVFISIAQSSDGMIYLYKDEEDLEKLKKNLSPYRMLRPHIEIRRDEDLETIKKSMWDMLGLIRIYCKEPGKKPEKKALVLKKGSTVEDAADDIHKDFTKYFRFARIWGSSKYPGEKVGFDYELKDKDIIEIHMG